MTDLIKINNVQPLKDRWLRIEFSDGAVKDVDLGEDRQAFQQVRVNAESHTIEWAGRPRPRPRRALRPT